MDLRNFIDEFENFPREGIIFRDIGPLLRNPIAWAETITRLTDFAQISSADLIAGIESRGFIVGASLASSLGLGFVPIRKEGKLPGDVFQVSYELEYGSDKLEINKNSMKGNPKVLIADDLLATGGTAKAAGGLIEKAGGRLIGYAFIIELINLKGRENLKNSTNIYSLISY